MKNYHIKTHMRVILLCVLCGSTSLVEAEQMKLDDVKFEIPGMAISKTNLKSGGALTSFKIIPKSIDSYSEQRIVGIIVATDASGNVMRVDPATHEVLLPDLSVMLSAIEAGMSMQGMFDKLRFADLTEVQRMGFLRKFSIALIVYEGDAIQVDFNDKTKGLINNIIRQFNLTLENDMSMEEMRKWSRLILRKVSIESR